MTEALNIYASVQSPEIYSSMRAIVGTTKRLKAMMPLESESISRPYVGLFGRVHHWGGSLHRYTRSGALQDSHGSVQHLPGPYTAIVRNLKQDVGLDNLRYDICWH